MKQFVKALLTAGGYIKYLYLVFSDLLQQLVKHEHFITTMTELPN